MAEVNISCEVIRPITSLHVWLRTASSALALEPAAAEAPELSQGSDAALAALMRGACALLMPSFAEGFGWLAQIGLFVMLGLLATPREFAGMILPALTIGLVMGASLLRYVRAATLDAL